MGWPAGASKALLANRLFRPLARTIDIVRVRGGLEPVAKNRVTDQRLEAGGDIGAMVLETVETVGRLELPPSCKLHFPLLAKWT